MRKTLLLILSVMLGHIVGAQGVNSPEANEAEDKRFHGVVIDDNSLPGYTIYRPFDMQQKVEQEGKLPLLVFGNGACSHNSSDYAPMFAELIKNGYLVFAVGTRDGSYAYNRHETSLTAKEDNLLDAVDWVCKQNATPGSDFYGMVDTFHIAVAGHSCGGAQAMAASYDPRISTTLLLNAGMGDMSMGGATPNSLKELHAPILYLIGGPEDVAYLNAKNDFERINHVPVVSVNFPVGHAGTYKQEKGGILGEVVSMWLDWLLKGKESASCFFVDPGYRDAHYGGGVFESKGLENIGGDF